MVALKCNANISYFGPDGGGAGSFSSSSPYRIVVPAAVLKVGVAVTAKGFRAAEGAAEVGEVSVKSVKSMESVKSVKSVK